MDEKVYLIDTNVFLEVLLSQDNAKSCLLFLEKINKGKIRAIVTNFSLFSISIVASRRKVSTSNFEIFFDLISQIENLEVLNIPFVALIEIYKIAQNGKLDFDDSVQFYAAKNLDIPIVTLDSDFKKAGIKAVSPNLVR